MEKFRIRVVELACGRKRYYPQKRSFFIFWKGYINLQQNKPLYYDNLGSAKSFIASRTVVNTTYEGL